MKSVRCTVLIAALSITFITASVSSAAGVPRQLRLKAQHWTGLPTHVYGVLADSKGHLWLEDGYGAKVYVYGSDGTIVRTIGGPGLNPGQLQSPWGMALDEKDDVLAVADSQVMLDYYSASSGRFKKRILLGVYSPQNGFFLTPTRIVFLGPGRKNLKAKVPSEFMTLFSTDRNGKDLHVAQTCPLDSLGQALGLVALSGGYATRLGTDRWAVAHSVPAQLFLVDAEGKILKATKPETSLPTLSKDGPATYGYVARFMNEHPLVIGIVRRGSDIGMVWRRPLKPGPQLSIEWFSKDLKRVGTTRLDVGRPLGWHDWIRGVAQVPSSKTIYLVLSTGSADGKTSTTTVFKGGMP